MMLWIYWDPRPELFVIPGIHWPILWYGLLFASGFFIGFPLFASILRRFFLQNPTFSRLDLLKEAIPSFSATGKTALVKELNHCLQRGESARIAAIPPTILKTWQKEIAQSRTPRGAEALARMALEREIGPTYLLSLRMKAHLLTDRLTLYMILATIFGARIGHFLFYERPSEYLSHPWTLFAMSRGGWSGLSSHGAALAILIALWLFQRTAKQWTEAISWVRLLDWVAIPTALAGSLIRIGNFINQEILGTPSNLPWAVLFGHPADYSAPLPRHPVQLYEALFYALVFLLLWRLSFRPLILCRTGTLIGLFLILVFSFRFCIEFVKMEQSHLLSHEQLFTMGQYLSIPLIILGIYFLLLPRKRE